MRHVVALPFYFWSHGLSLLLQAIFWRKQTHGLAPRAHSSQILTRIHQQFLLPRSDVHRQKNSSQRRPAVSLSPHPPASRSHWHLSLKNREYPQPEGPTVAPGLPPAHPSVLLLCQMKLKVGFSRAVRALMTLAWHPLCPHHLSYPLLCGLEEIKPHLTKLRICFQAV